MLIILKPGIQKKKIDEIMAGISNLGLKPLYLPGTEKIVLGAIGDERKLESLQLDALPFIERVVPVLEPYKLVGRSVKSEPSKISVGSLCFSPQTFPVIAGPCSVEGESEIIDSAQAVKEAGAKGLRGGAFKPRTSPYAFQGLREKGLKFLSEARKKTGLPIVTEILNPEDVTHYKEYYDILQIGARNMQNYDLLKAAGSAGKPVLLKRGPAARLEEFLMAAEYILVAGNPDVILCERGIRTFETALRNTLDLAGVAWLKSKTHLPVIVDPSHGIGVRSLVPAGALAALAIGADGLIIEVHPSPENAASDGAQSLSTEEFITLMTRLRELGPHFGRTL